jgi:hypothetical protein
LAQITFTSFFGVLGLFLAIPLVIIVRILLHEILIKDVLDQWKLNSAHDNRGNQVEDRSMLPHDLPQDTSGHHNVSTQEESTRLSDE